MLTHSLQKKYKVLNICDVFGINITLGTYNFLILNLP